MFVQILEGRLGAAGLEQLHQRRVDALVPLGLALAARALQAHASGTQFEFAAQGRSQRRGRHARPQGSLRANSETQAMPWSIKSLL
jgi:hypothetical protein